MNDDDNVSKEIRTNKYSVYELWVAGENHPFYVGKGVSRRPYSHLGDARSGEKSHRSSKIRKAWRMSLPIIIKHVLRTDIEQEAFNEEKRLIEFYGRRDLSTGSGSLVNHTNGGEGFAGRIKSDEERQRLSIRMKGNTYGLGKSYPGRILSEEHREKISGTMTGRLLTKVHREKMSLASIGKPKSDEHRLNIRSGKKGKKLSDEHRRKIGEGGKGRVVSEETRIKISKAKVGKIKSDEHRQKLSMAMKGKKLPPRSKEYCQNLSKSIKMAWDRKIQAQKNLTNLNELLSLNGGI